VEISNKHLQLTEKLIVILINKEEVVRCLFFSGRVPASALTL
jgi:hypothetical protein